MKKILTIVLPLIAASISNAQDISATFNPKVGNSYFVYGYKNTIHATGNSGVNQVYDFSDLSAIAKEGKISYFGSVDNPDPDAFPSCNVFSSDPREDYVYFKTANNVYNVIGRTLVFEGSAKDIVYSNSETITLPIKYNTLQVDKNQAFAQFTSSGLPVKLYRTGVDSIKIDGYGTLKLHGKDKKVNRLKIVHNYTDSAKYISDGIKRKNIIRKEEYWYVGVDEDYPSVVVIKEKTNAIVQASSNITTNNMVMVYSKDELTALENNDLNSASMQVYQNESGQLTVKGIIGNVISIYNTKGELLIEATLKSEKQIIADAILDNYKGNLLLVKTSVTNYTVKIILE